MFLLNKVKLSTNFLLLSAISLIFSSNLLFSANNVESFVDKPQECLEAERDCAGKCFGRAEIQSDGKCRLPNDRNTYSIFDNGSLRFGNAYGTGITESSFSETENSVNEYGNLRQPFYFDQSNNVWYKLTYSNYALNFALAIDGDGSSDWNMNGTVDYDASAYGGLTLQNQVLDLSGFTYTDPSNSDVGTGTIVSTGNVSIAGKSVEIENTYTLDPGSSFIRVNTKLTNISGSDIGNIRYWAGTKDDWVGLSDGPTETRGNIIDGEFVALSSADQSSNAIKIESSGSGVVFFSTSENVNTSISYCCSFQNAVTQNPSNSSVQLTGDGSYAIFKRFNDLANGESDNFEWFYAAGEVGDLGEIVEEVEEAAVPGCPYISCCLLFYLR